ncbi:MAG: acyl carrier protein [Firmicutes bacterium]|nr:acyl carrier protein [Bacillota bacterium]
MASVFDTVKKNIVDILEVDGDEITLESSFSDQMGADSLDLVEIITAMEEEYEIRIPDKDLEGMTTVGDLVEYLQKTTGKE